MRFLKIHRQNPANHCLVMIIHINGKNLIIVHYMTIGKTALQTITAATPTANMNWNWMKSRKRHKNLILKTLKTKIKIIWWNHLMILHFSLLNFKAITSKTSITKPTAITVSSISNNRNNNKRRQWIINSNHNQSLSIITFMFPLITPVICNKKPKKKSLKINKITFNNHKFNNKTKVQWK